MPDANGGQYGLVSIVGLDSENVRDWSALAVTPAPRGEKTGRKKGAMAKAIMGKCLARLPSVP